ncbi:MAG: ABC transporter ATP-binding protein [Planctomycetota bacterium]|jgi:branched-chain amino acid transport system ATP-binding protein|nr:ABC transporter ATP-binding protein [Planctomycetota bacterium]
MLLEAKGVTIRFGGLVAVNHADVSVQPGRITGLIGPNGAGKTTFFNCISGVYRIDAGEVVFAGRRIDNLRGFQINEAGISRTYQVINLFRKMSALDNVMVGMHSRLRQSFWASLFHAPGQRAEERIALAKARDLLKFVGLERKAEYPAGNLSYGEQRLLEIVRGLASDPKLILLDEPAAGMNSGEKAQLDLLLKRILGTGVTILMIEHDMKLMMGVADYIYVLNYGSVLAQGEPAEIQRNPDVITAYLGGE